MRCPWCGSPVRIRGNTWECGYCGDSGKLKVQDPQEQEDETISLHLTLSFSDDDEEEDLPAEEEQEDYWIRSDAEAISRLGLNNDVSFDADCRDILVSRFPALFAGYTTDDFEDFYLESFMSALYEEDPVTAFKVWKSLLDAIDLPMEEGPVWEALEEAKPFPQEDYDYYFS